MTEIATIDWFGRWGTCASSENTAIFYFIMQPLLEKKKEAKTYFVFLLSDRVGSPPSCLFGQEPQRFLRKQIL